MAERLECWTSNSEALSSNPALASSRVPSSNPCHTCKIANWFTSYMYQLGFLTPLCSIEIICFIIPEKPLGLKCERIIKVLLLLLLHCTCYCDF